MDEISFMILARAGTDDPLPEFVCGVAYREAIVLDELLRALSRLVDEGLLTCRLDGKENKDWASQDSRTGILGELVAYVKRRIQMDEWMKADMSKYPQYVFTLTPAGAELLERFFVDAATEGRGVIEAIRGFRRQYGRYPAELCELWPEYQEASASPFHGCGAWWYRLADSGEAFRFGYLTLYGHHHFYDSIGDRWEPEIPGLMK